MARGGGSGGFTFELVPDDEADDARPDVGVLLSTPEGPDDDIPPSLLSRAFTRALAWLRSRSPRQLVAGAVALVVLVAAAGTASVLRDREHEARVRAAPGGVVDLSAPVRTRWERTFETGMTVPVGAYPGGVVAALEHVGPSLDGPPSVATNDGRDDDPVRPVLHALDPDTGEDSWRVELEPGARCGEMGYGETQRLTIPVTDQIVCVSGSGAHAQVDLVDATGAVTSRPVAGLRRTGKVLVGPAGTVLRVERLGTVADVPALQDDNAGGYRLTGAYEPADLRLTLEDAATGAQRWQQDLGASEVNRVHGWWTCTRWNDAGRPTFDPEAIVSFSVANRLVQLVGCGVEVVVTASGRVVSNGVVGENGVRQSPVVLPLVDGDLAVVDGPDGASLVQRATVVQDTAGHVLRRLDGGVLDPWAVDGPADVTVGLDDGAAVGFGPDGEELWRNDELRFADGAVVRGGGVLAVVRRADGSTKGELVGVDLRTGRTLWTTPVDVAAGGVGVWGYARSAWTDGRVAVLVSNGSAVDQGTSSWTAYDLRTGAVAWRVPPRNTDDLVPRDGVCATLEGGLVCLDGRMIKLLG